MPTRKIGDVADMQICRHRDHNPGSMQVFAPGVYEHVCPACGTKQTFVVRPGPSLSERNDCDEF